MKATRIYGNLTHKLLVLQTLLESSTKMERGKSIQEPKKPNDEHIVNHIQINSQVFGVIWNYEVYNYKIRL